MDIFIFSETNDFSQFIDSDKTLAFADILLLIYQLGQLDNSHSHIEKQLSQYLRYTLFTTATYSYLQNTIFKTFSKNASSFFVTYHKETYINTLLS